MNLKCLLMLIVNFGPISCGLQQDKKTGDESGSKTQDKNSSDKECQSPQGQWLVVNRDGAPKSRVGHVASTTDGRIVFADNSRAIFIFDPCANTWQTGATPPTPAERSGSFPASDGSAVFFYGTDKAIFSIKDNAWLSWPNSSESASSFFADSSNAYFLPGDMSSYELGKIEVVDYRNDTHTTSILAEGQDKRASISNNYFLSDGKSIIFPEGCPAANQNRKLNKGALFDLTSKTWQAFDLAPGLQDACQMQGAWVDDAYYAWGGHKAGTSGDRDEDKFKASAVYSKTSNAWRALAAPPRAFDKVGNFSGAVGRYLLSVSYPQNTPGRPLVYGLAYDIDTDKWVEIETSNIPVSKSGDIESPSLHGTSKHLFFFRSKVGGHDPNGFVYDPKTNSWNEVAEAKQLLNMKDDQFLDSMAESSSAVVLLGLKQGKDMVDAAAGVFFRE